MADPGNLTIADAKRSDSINGCYVSVIIAEVWEELK